ncbi:unnamed protein product [Mytilus edulis]|uniref:Tyr recombinase domain-containing protein n=1 Tax=Mytilus edulis TaxID=6550 RepID=A0A8S3UIU1_MYTED|nr:unnamed protein product [Mytilus edulis]
MGGTKSIDCNTISRQIWLFCKDNDIWLTCTHIAGKENLADKKSREFDDKLEWKLERSVFDQLCTLWQRPDIDLFASRLNFQLENYCSWKPDPLSAFIDAFTRGALSSLGLTIDSIPVGRHAMVIRYMKGIFNLRPPRPRYESTWDVSKVLHFLRSLSPVKYLKLKDLTLKLTMLIALTNAARAQSIHLMNVNHVHKVKGEFIFVLNELVKQSRPGYKEPTVNIKAYPPDRRLCVYTVYKEYVFRTKLFRGKHEPLLLSYVKPHQPVSRDTISRWIKVVMAKANIDTTIFKAHSVRSASVSKAKMNAVPISRILQKAGWSDAKTFAKFYNKKIEKDENSFSFNVLKN